MPSYPCGDLWRAVRHWKPPSAPYRLTVNEAGEYGCQRQRIAGRDQRVGLDKANYDACQHAVYVEGRALSAQAAQLWRVTFTRWADPRRPLAVLDLGSGTGRFAPMLADTFGGPVYGVEPSTRMRQMAEGRLDTRGCAIGRAARSTSRCPTVRAISS
jgi:SAM-dependent methyltransferase